MNIQTKPYRNPIGIIVKLFIALLILLSPLVNYQLVQAAPFRIYVDADASGANDGSTWEDAYKYLQDALDETNADGSHLYEIWVAEGVYYPDEDKNGDHTDNSQAEFFQIKYDNVALYGGFSGSETSREQRDWETNLTILSGDLEGNDTNTDGNYIAEDWNDIIGNNAYHVLLLDGATNEHITHDTVVDGFTITGGEADAAAGNKYGGGLECFAAGSITPGACSPTLRNLVIQGNRALTGGGVMLYTNYEGVSHPYMTNIDIIGNLATDGGGMYVFVANDPAGESFPVLVNVTFRGNYATSDGGGMANFTHMGQVSPTLINVEFYDNEAQGDGGGMYNYLYLGTSLTKLRNVTFSDNQAAYGGGIYNQLYTSGTFGVEVFNSILWMNSATVAGAEIYNLNMLPEIAYSDIQGCGGSGSGWVSSCGLDNGGNIDKDPRFEDPAMGELALQLTSPAVEAGFSDLLPQDTTDVDQDGNTSEIIPLDLKENPRVVCNSVDMGAYEFQGLPLFSDVACSHWAHDFIHILYLSGVTGGCGTNPLVYCPADTVTRDQMAVFLERGIHGSGYSPPAPSGIFDDVPVDYWAAKWIEALYNDGVTGGCGGNNYCPGDPVTRAQMAVFLLRSKHGAAYDPPAATGQFNDVPTDYWAADWIEQLAAEGITSGCGGGNYCPEDSVTRAQMAVFLVRTFNLTIP